MYLSHYGKARAFLPLGAEMVVAKMVGCRMPEIETICMSGVYPWTIPRTWRFKKDLVAVGFGWGFWFLGMHPKKSSLLVEMMIGKTCLETCWGILQEPEFY